MSGWDDARVETLKTLWRRGLSARQIAEKLGCVSRNAVIGKARRLHLAHRTESFHKATRALPSSRLTVIKAVKPQSKMFGINAGRPPKLPQPLPVLRGPSLAIEPRPWLTRLFGECAYPVDGEGAETRSCCAPCAGARYCGQHHKLMYAKPSTDAQRRAAALARAAKAKKMQAAA